MNITFIIEKVVPGAAQTLVYIIKSYIIYMGSTSAAQKTVAVSVDCSLLSSLP